MRRIDQILPSLVYGDAVSNDTIALMNILREMGYNSNIYAENIGPKVNKIAKPLSQYKPGNKDDVVIFHMSIGTKLSYMMMELKDTKKVMIYHNITPSEFFRSYNRAVCREVDEGRMQLKMMSNTFDYSLADSEYNEQELKDCGYKNTGTLPILIPFDDYKKEPDKNIIKKYKDGRTNILFVGRVAPNKKHEDVIKTFYYYKNYIDKDSRLFFVGSYHGIENYYDALKELVEELQLKDVYFTGHTTFAEILGYYRVADVFLCMSEHEGFCVPLVECMNFEVPIVAYKSSAIPYTLGDSGVLVNEKDYIAVAELVNEVVTNKELRERIIKKQNERLSYFSNEKVGNMFKEYLKDILGD